MHFWTCKFCYYFVIYVCVFVFFRSLLVARAEGFIAPLSPHTPTELLKAAELYLWIRIFSPVCHYWTSLHPFCLSEIYICENMHKILARVKSPWRARRVGHGVGSVLQIHRASGEYYLFPNPSKSF